MKEETNAQCCSCGGFCKKGKCERSNVIPLPADRYDLQVMVMAIKEALYSKPGQPVNFVEALGALELVKMELFEDMMNRITPT